MDVEADRPESTRLAKIFSPSVNALNWRTICFTGKTAATNVADARRCAAVAARQWAKRARRRRYA
jgi:hypothetical protein